ncbi:helix-turn-helix domain-containing protein [Streptomyces sp. NPDC056361]|uniref:helix-turn-helix domain-containing protein n=1 Tax=Streptomyces sp. NPDC056361 TaxID=3345795 RepID=UPI0035E1F9A1
MEIEQPAFGRRLRRLRLESGLTQGDLAGGPVSTSYVSRIESGSRLPSEETLCHLAGKLGLDVAQLVSSDGSQDSWGATMAEVSTALADKDLSRVIDLLESRCELPARLPEDWAWQALWARSLARSEMEDPVGQREDLRQLVVLTRKWESPCLLARLLVELSRAERKLGGIAEARTAAQEALSLVDEFASGTHTLRVSVRLALIAAETEAGLLAQAAARIPDVLHMAADAPSEVTVQAYWTCSGVRIRQGLFPEGRELIAHALSAMDSRRDLLGWARLRLAAVSLELRCPEPSSPAIHIWLQEAADALRYVGDPIHHAELTAVAARAHLMEGRPADALTQAAAAEDTGLLTFHDRLRTRLLRAEATMRLGRHQEGVRLAQSVAEESEGAGYLDLAAEAWKAVAVSRELPPAV